MIPSTNHVREIIEAPVFIIGCQRSGTTWLQRLLISHPSLCGGQESHFFRPSDRPSSSIKTNKNPIGRLDYLPIGAKKTSKTSFSNCGTKPWPSS